jgi:hypothetical protein
MGPRVSDPTFTVVRWSRQCFATTIIRMMPVHTYVGERLTGVLESACRAMFVPSVNIARGAGRAARILRVGWESWGDLQSLISKG